MEPDFRPFSCDTCDKRYLRKNNLEDHVLMEHPDSEQASDIVALKASKGRSKGSLIIECEICSKKFRYQSDLKNHFETHFRQPGRRGRLSSSVLAQQSHQARLVPHLDFPRSEARAESEEPEVRPDSHKAREGREGRAPAVVLQLIDRTVEEFGEDDGDEGDYPSFYHPYSNHYTNLLLPPPPPRTQHTEKTFTVLLSEDDSNTSSLVTTGGLSPPRVVPDLSLAKHDKLPPLTLTNGNGHSEEEAGRGEESSDSQEDRLAEVTETRSEAGDKGSAEDDFENVGEDGTISIEPSRLPNMPSAIIAIQSQLEQYLNGLTEEEWMEFEEAGLVDNYSPPQRDNSRLDCKYCGIIFTDLHVRKFHEESHVEAKSEDNYDEGEHTRLFCGFCAKMFKSVKFRKLHEMTHNPEDEQFLEENLEYLREMELKNKMLEAGPEDKIYKSEDTFKTAPKPLSQAKIRPRLIDQEGWVEDHPSLPKGWRMKTRPRPSQEGQLFFVFLSPDNKVFHSRKAVIEHMKLIGGYSQVDYDRVKEGAKPGPRNKKRRAVAKQDQGQGKRRKVDCSDPTVDFGSLDSNFFNSRDDEDDEADVEDSDLDFPDSEEDDDEEEEEEGSAEDVRSLYTQWRDHHSIKPKWKMRAVELPGGKTSFQYLSPDGKIFESRKEMVRHHRRPRHSDLNKKGIKELRKKMPKRKKLISNQVIVTKTTNNQRKTFLAKNKKKKSDPFRFEPVIFVPKLNDILVEPDSYEKKDFKCFSVDLEEDLKDLAGVDNNVDDILRELRERQLDYASKMSSSEDEEEQSMSSISGRTLRKRTARMVYEEPPLEDELDSKFFKSLRQQVKGGSVERIPVNGVATPTTTTENTNTGSVCTEEEDEEEEEEDYMSDSWEAELFSLKRNPREKLRFQEEDNAILTDWFCRNPYPDKQEQSDIGKILMVPVKTVKHWFQTKRVKCKESGKTLRKKEDKRSLVMEGEARGEGGQKYCRLCRQSFSLSLHLKLHNKRFHKKKVKSKRKKDRKNQRRWDLRRNHQEKLTRSKAMIEKQVLMKSLAPVDDLHEIYEHIEYKGIQEKDQIRELKQSYSWNKNPKKEELSSLAQELDLSVSAVTGWFRNQRRTEEIECEVKERIICSPSILRHNGRTVSTAKDWLSNRNNRCAGKRSSLNTYQRSYLKFYFMQKQFVETDEINEISCELSLSCETVSRWFEKVRAKKKIKQPTAPTGQKGKARGRPKKITIDTSSISFDSDDEHLFDLDLLDTQTSSIPIVFASKSRGIAEASKDGNLLSLSDHQRSRLETFHEKVENPDDDDMDFLVDHLRISRQTVVSWFDCKRKEREYEKKESVILCRELLSEFVHDISKSRNFSFLPVPEFSCKYCGEKFMDEQEFIEHENIEAEEFEPEKFNFQTNNNHDLDSVESPEESRKLEDMFVSDEDEADTSSHYEDSVDISLSSYKGKYRKTDKQSRSNNNRKTHGVTDSKRKSEKVNFRNYFPSPVKKFEFDEYSGVSKRKSITTYKGYFCKKCKTGFHLKSSLFNHLSQFHPGEEREPAKRYELQVGLQVGKDEGERRSLRCDDCSSEFRTRSELSRHLYSHYADHQHQSDSREDGSQARNHQYYSPDTDLMSHLYQDDEPVTYETFSKYFDSKDVVTCNNDDDTQNYFDISRLDSISWNSPDQDHGTRDEDFEIKKEKTRTKIKFTDVQRGILMRSFRQSFKMTKNDLKSLHEELAETLELPVTTVKVWFQNAKSARKKGNPHYM